MQYEDIWRKMLAEGERVEYEFSISGRYLMYRFIFWVIIGLIVWSTLEEFMTGAVIVAIAAFYYLFYKKKANAYALTGKRVVAHNGWLSTHTTSVDYDKITDVRVEEPFIDKLVTKTGNFAIVTAGTGSQPIVFKHVDSPYELKKKLDTLRK